MSVGFEDQLKEKLTKKCPSNQSEETFLVKCFKFFDIRNKGEVDFEQFYRAVEKIGVIIEKSVICSLSNLGPY
jgi:Ca2+-binding EF-hand superfamily protein